MLYLQAPLFVPIILGLIDLIILWMALNFCFYRSVIDVSLRSLTVSGGLFGLGATKRIEASEVEKIDMAIGLQSNTSVYYRLVVRRHGGKPVTAAKYLSGKRLATSLTQQIEEAMGVSAK
jgi:hypothetical protein